MGEGHIGSTDSVLQIRVFGRVQGVGFRYYAMSHARKLGLAGWVRNEDDGSVLITVSGKGDAVKRFTDAVRGGPRSSRVQRIETAQVPDNLEDLPSWFEIR